MKITKVLGTDELYAYLEKYDIELDSQYDELLGRYVLCLDGPRGTIILESS